MTDQGSYNSALQEIQSIFSFLTEGKPTPDDEIEAKDKLINQFSRLKNNSTYSEEITFIEGIIQKLDDWDTLDLWFSETSLPDDIMKILNIPARVETPKEEGITGIQKTPIEHANGESEIDLTDIFSKVSDQFKGEIETLKGTIDTLKKELEKKDESVKPPTRKREVYKITPNPNAKLAPPVIKIPVIKKLVKPPQVKQQSIPKTPTTPVSENYDIFEEQLTPIPVEPEEIPLPVEDHDLTPIPKKVPNIETVVIEESKAKSKDRPLITEKRKITSFIPDKPKEVSASESTKLKPFLIEKPKISAVKIEEIESESIVSSGSDLFNVFSSMGSKSPDKPQKIIGFTEKSAKIEEKKKDEKRKKKSKDTQDPSITPFINFNNSSEKAEPDLETPNLDIVSDDKDALYQELIALEGRRYSLERNFKDIEKNFNKGSISEADFKRQNNILKKQLNEITLRINNIRGVISSL
ncbi:MAG: hypothetical protein HWN80_11740 [Candidatus Lokiarchaeota archaeon]|nr:hypothetical protein [Candidatus Lokiarchaeota archaeon]